MTAENRTDKIRMEWLFGHMAEALGIEFHEFKGKTEAEGKAMIKDAIAEKGAVRSGEKRALATGEMVILAGKEVDLKPLPAAKMAGWRQSFVAKTKKIREGDDYSEDSTTAALEELDRTVLARVDLLKSYVNLQGSKWSVKATDCEIEKAMEVAYRFAFPFAEGEIERLAQMKAIEQMTKMAQNLGPDSSLSSPAKD